MFSGFGPVGREKVVLPVQTGEVTHYIARRLAPNAHILAIDVSEENIHIARTLFENARVTYRKGDVLSASVE